MSLGTLGTIAAATVGALVSLTVSFLANRASDRRQQNQLDYDRKARIEDRDLELRKDIYMSVVEAGYIGLNTITSLSNIDKSVTEITKSYIEQSASVSKLYLFSAIDTSRLVTEVFTKISSAILALSAARMPLDLKRLHVGTLTGVIERYSKDQSRWLEEMKNFNLNALADTNKWAYLERSHKSASEYIETHTTEKNAIWLAIVRDQAKFSLECFSATQEVGSVIVPALSAMRKELGISTNADAISQIFQASQEAGLRAVTEFHNSVDRSLATSMKDVPDLKGS